MKKQKISNPSRIVLFLCGVALIAVLFLPIWRIELDAPQYPEGLYLTISANKLGGNVEIINGLNHYIGMRTLHEDDFMEFKILPAIIAFFVLAFCTVALLGRRSWMNILLVLFVAFGALAMFDFWRWEYDYGHNLDPDAAIKVPGMSYQPPLIGFKQLLNFGAYSIPDKGGWIFVGAGLILLGLVIYEARRAKKTMRVSYVAPLIVLSCSLLALSGCKTGPEKIIVGKDQCHFCKMTISDVRFGAELVTKKGRVMKYDEAHCLLESLKSGVIPKEEIGGLYLTDYSGNHDLIAVDNALLLKSEHLKSPMNGQIAAFGHPDSLQKLLDSMEGGTRLTWKDISQ